MEEKVSRERFLKLGAAIGVSTAGASVVASCGGGEESGGSGDNGGGNQSAGGTTEQGSSGGQAIAQTSEVEPGSAVSFRDSGNPAVLVHLQDGDFVAYSAVCTHQQCEVSYQDGQLVCPCHGSAFDPADGGAVVTGPAEQPLPDIPVQVQNGEVVRA